MRNTLSLSLAVAALLLPHTSSAKPGSDGFFKNTGDAVLALDYQVDTTVCLQAVGKSKKLPLDLPKLSINGIPVTLLRTGMTMNNKTSSQKIGIAGMELAGRTFNIEDKAITFIKFCFDSSSVGIFSDTTEVKYTLSLAGQTGSVTALNSIFKQTKTVGTQAAIPNFKFEVLNKDGTPAAGVEITLTGLNDSDNYTIATIMTDTNGIAEVKDLSMRPSFKLLMFSVRDGDSLRSGSFDVTDSETLQQLKEAGSSVKLQLQSR